MKTSIIILLLMIVIYIEGGKLYPSSFPIIHDLNKNSSDETFHVACQHSWSILGSIPGSTGFLFPQDLLPLTDNPGFTIHVECPTNQKSMKLTFLAPNCETEHENFKENPIIFEIYEREQNSSKIKFRRLSSCLGDVRRIIEPMQDTGYIGHVSDKIWYLLHWSYVYPYKKGSKVRFGLIIFGRDTEDNDAVLKNTLKEVNLTFFNGLLQNDIFDDFHKKNNDECKLYECYRRIYKEPKVDEVRKITENPIKNEGDTAYYSINVIVVGLMIIWINI